MMPRAAAAPAARGLSNPAPSSLPAGARIVAGPTQLKLPLRFSAFTGCSNEWGRTSYWRHGPFSVDIATVRSASTCGSPIFASGPWWAGFLREAGGGVESNGRELTFTLPEGQELLVFENAPRDLSAWNLYRELAAARMEVAPAPTVPGAHAYEWEFCTWVEQKRITPPRRHSRTVLNDDLVRQLVARVQRLGLPPGKFTIDDGWQECSPSGGWTDGYWRPNRDAFPDLAATCRHLQSEGFTPGLWFGVGRYPKYAYIRERNPALFGAWESGGESESSTGNTWTLSATEETEKHFREVLRPYAEMGFRKFKFDFFYGERARMLGLIRTLHRAVRSLDPAIEIESHHPDFFFSRWCDTVRLNDVLIQPGRDWEGLTLAHMRVTHLCAPDRIMNLDHLGGNDPQVGEADYLRHLEILDTAPRDVPRYAVLSVLPDVFAPETRRRVVDFVRRQHGPV